jgi:CBS-domain-containing membrane protein
MTMRHMRGDPAEGPSDERASFEHEALVGDRMSRPVITVAVSATLTDALELLATHRIHYLPVVDEHALLVGMVNSDDVLGTRRREPRGVDTVAAVMSAPAVSIGPAAPLAEAMNLLADRGIGALPVVQDGHVVGILTQSDVVTAAASRRRA